MEPKIESKVTYNDRKKELTHITIETREGKLGDEVIGIISLESKGIYTEQGIRKILKDLSQKRTQLEQAIKQIKDDIKTKPELTKDLKELKEKLTKLQTIDQIEKKENQLKQNKEDLNKIIKDINDIKSAIGTRLKL